ncbi:MAG: endonuclease/exonuclease/phosphatase family protein [Bacteroidales bacterium]
MKKLMGCVLVSLSLTNCAQTPADEINWATFNIRYDNPADAPHHWEARKERVAQYILDNKIDIVGMQEVLHGQFEALKASLPEFAAVGVGREDGKEGGEYAPIFYRKARFKLLDSGTFWLSQYPDSVGFIGWDGACTRIATWTKMKDLQANKIFMAVNTHFDHVGVEARTRSALLIIEKMKEVAGENPVVLTGDFNVSEEWDAYKTITSNSYVLKDAHKIAKEKAGVNYTFHNFDRLPEKERQIIDFIFVSPQVEVLRSEIPGANVNPEGLLSDHNPQISTLRFQ